MGLNFRKSFKIGGVRLNIGKKGLSSVSVGTKGARVSLGRKGARSTVSIPKTGLSYTTHHPYKRNRETTPQNTDQPQSNSLATGIIIFFVILFFVWLFS